MECSCSVDVDIDDVLPSFFKTKNTKAIKEHKCRECRRVIAKGEEYEKTSGCWDGRFDCFKTCSDCIGMITEFFRDGYYYGRIWEDFETHVDAVDAAISESCLSKLTPVARGRACDIIQAWWDEDEALNGEVAMDAISTMEEK